MDEEAKRNKGQNAKNLQKENRSKKVGGLEEQKRSHKKKMMITILYY